MECPQAQEAILESFERARPAGVEPALAAHLAACPECVRFAARQKRVDARLSEMLTPPEMSPRFRTALRKRIRREKMRSWSDSLPDAVHFASSGLATLVCAMLLPFDASTVWAGGAAIAVVTYIALIAVRSAFETVEDAD
jgi:anti-sigma factor RsiW